MPLVNFSTFVKEVAPYLAGCPTAVIESQIRKVTIDLCERAKVWVVTLPSVPTIPGDAVYALAPVVVEAEVSSVETLSLTTPTVTKELTPQISRPITDPGPGEPYAYSQPTSASVELFPTPDAASYTLGGRVAIRPTDIATSCEQFILSDYRRAIFHGVLYELMEMPDRPWSDEKGAIRHGKQWGYFVYLAKAKSNSGNGAVSLFVRQRPWG